jgi:acyl-CoA dehydrogenase
MLIESFHMGLADGPTEVHKVTVARQVLSEYEPTEGLFPTRHIPRLREEAIARYGDLIEHHLAEL